MDRVIRARAVLAEMTALGLTIDDLVAAGGTAPATDGPTVADYVEVIAASYKPGTRATYASGWRVLCDLYGDRPIATVTADDCHRVVDEATERAKQRRPGSNGRSSAESCVGALRALFRRAAQAGLVTTDPARALEKPRRLESRRRALTDAEVAEVRLAVTNTSTDPGLDLLLVWFHLETGARREGALNLTIARLDLDRQTLWLLEKFGAEREQPVSATLLDAVADHARSRGARQPGDPVFRYKNGRAMSRRRYNTLFDHVQAALPWSARTPVTAHVLRHTAITRVERRAGYAVAARFAGHTTTGSVTGTYVKATVEEVATAVQEVTGQPHPLATAPLSA